MSKGEKVREREKKRESVRVREKEKERVGENQRESIYNAAQLPLTTTQQPPAPKYFPLDRTV